MSSITAEELTATDRKLVATVQVRLTRPQDQLLRAIVAESGLSLSSVVRDIVVCWAANRVNEPARLVGEPDVIDIHALVDELKELAASEGAE